MNFIVITFDSLRKDCLSGFGLTPPWGDVHTPHLDSFAAESTLFDRSYPEVLPTLPARRALYTGQRVYPFANGDVRLKGDEVYAPGWGPIAEDQTTLAEMFAAHGYRTALISDLYHQFKPSKNFSRGFEQWTFLRGQEIDRFRSGPRPAQSEIDYWLAAELQGDTGRGVEFVRRCLQNMAGRQHEEEFFNARVMTEASRWLVQNREAERFFLVVECFDPHEPWFVPTHYRQLYEPAERREHVISTYQELDDLPPDLLQSARMNYSALVTMVDRWFGHFMETVRLQGRLDDTIIAVLSDHGHSLGERNYMGKRGYPSEPEVFETILMIRHPDGTGAGTRCGLFVQHTDVAAQLLDFAGIASAQAIDGRPFWQPATRDGAGHRDHVTVGWGATMTVINHRWWLNCMVDGSRALLYDLTAADPFGMNVAPSNPAIVDKLFAFGVEDSGGDFPDFLLKEARGELQLPSWNPLAAADQPLGYL
jgi:arylsulfatase A-like enzyme